MDIETLQKQNADLLVALQQVKEWDINGWMERGFALPTELRAKIQSLVTDTPPAADAVDLGETLRTARAFIAGHFERETMPAAIEKLVSNLNDAERRAPATSAVDLDGEALRQAMEYGIQIHFEGQGADHAVWADDVMIWTDGNVPKATRSAIEQVAANRARATAKGAAGREGAA